MSRVTMKVVIVCALVSGSSLDTQAQIANNIQTPGRIQTPGEIQTPRGPWQTPGKIQIPGRIQGIEVRDEKCKQRLSISADTLFEFDKAAIAPKAETTLKTVAPAIAKVSQYPIQIEGHTDSIGSAAYRGFQVGKDDIR